MTNEEEITYQLKLINKNLERIVEVLEKIEEEGIYIFNEV